jgi:hypothetical protein
VVANAPDAAVYLLHTLVPLPTGPSVLLVARASMLVAGSRAVEGVRTTINGLEAYVGVYQGQIEGLGAVTSRAAHLLHGNAYYLVAGLVSPELFRQADAAFVGSIR